MSIDYSVLDKFCKVSTWYSMHPLDQRRFVDALMEVVDHPEFTPGAAIEYIRANYANPTWHCSEDELDELFARLEDQAFAVWYSRGGGS